jgi:hypothetical protein
VGANNGTNIENTTPISLYSVFTKVGILEGLTYSYYRGGEKMAKNKNSKFMKDSNALPKADIEFARENGLERKALRALKSQNK